MEINELLEYLVSMGGSDLHLIAGLPPAIRLHGELTPVEGTHPIMPNEMQGMVFSILEEDQRRRFERDPDTRFELDFAYGMPGVGRFRVNVHKQRGSVAATIRALAKSIPKMDSLGLPPAVIRFTEAKKGLALVTGPTGSGKSTTLAAILDRVNETRPDHIITIEDPIEYLHQPKKSYVTQREVGTHGDTLSFRNALKYALRQDPDVILIGEMRDYETIGIAITSAETGHLVFGTLHTSSAAQTVGRVIDVFPSDMVEQVKTQFAANCIGVLAQILVPKVDGAGRALAAELMFANAAIRNNIRGNNIDAIYQSIQTGANEGMLTMDAALGALVRANVISFSTARPYMKDQSMIAALKEFDRPEPVSGARHASPVAAAPTAAKPAAAPEPAAAADRKRAVIPPWEMNK